MRRWLLPEPYRVALGEEEREGRQAKRARRVALVALGEREPFHKGEEIEDEKKWYLSKDRSGNLNKEKNHNLGGKKVIE